MLISRPWALVSLFSLFAPCAAFADAPPPPYKVEVQGHRGARARRPENSLPAFDYALEQGVDVLEMDLGVTKDGVLVLNHDPDIDPTRCTRADGTPLTAPIPIHSLTLKEVKSFSCGALPHPRFPEQQKIPDTKIPTFDEVIRFVKASKWPAAKKVGFNIETKSFLAKPEASPAPEEFAKLLLDAIKRHGILDRSVIQSFDYRTLYATRKLEPKARIAALVEFADANLIELARVLQPDFISPRSDLLRIWDVTELHKAGVKLVVWTANTEDEWEILTHMKVDSIISDDPAALIAFLKKKGLR